MAGWPLHIYAPTTQWRSQVIAFLRSIPWITPEEFGAVGNGTRDDTAAFERAVADGRPILANPLSTYAVDDVHITSATTCPAIFSIGGHARFVPSASSGTRLFLVTKPDGFLFESLSFELPISTDPLTSPPFDRALEFAPEGSNGSDYQITDCRFSGGVVAVVMQYVVRNSRVAGNYVTATWGNGISCQCLQNVEIVDNILEDGGYATGASMPSGAIRAGYSLQLESSRNLLISRNIIARYCVASEQNAIDCFSGAASNIRVTENICDKNGAGIELKTTKWTIGTPDIYQSNVIAGNTICLLDDIDTNGITVFHATTDVPQGKMANFLVNDNLIFCDTPPASGMTHYGIAIGGAGYTTVEGNRIYDVGKGINLTGIGAVDAIAYNMVVSGNTVDVVDEAIIRSGATGTIDGLVIRDNPLLRTRTASRRALNITNDALTINMDVSGNRIESVLDVAVEFRNVQDSAFTDNTLIGATNAVLSQGIAADGVKFIGNRVVAATGPAFALSTGINIEIQSNNIDVPVGSETVTGAATYTTAANVRGLAAANPTGTAGGSLGDVFLDSTAATAGWRCTIAGIAGVAVYT